MVHKKNQIAFTKKVLLQFDYRNFNLSNYKELNAQNNNKINLEPD